MAASRTNLWETLRRTSLGRAVHDDPKKAGILGALVLLLLIVAVRAVVMMTPSVAPASIPAPPGGSGLGILDKPNDTSRTDEASKALQDWLTGPVGALSHNVFAANLESFPADGKQTAHGSEEGGFWDELAKSVQTQADEKGKRRQVVDRIMAEAAQLKFQSTLMGSRPQAMIDGRLVGVGDVIGSFRVVKIESRKIIVEHVEQKNIRLAIGFGEPEDKK